MFKKLSYPRRCVLYNLGYRIAGSLDGAPFPPSRLINLVIGTTEISWYQLGGMYNAKAFTNLLCRNGIAPEKLETMLDFGCGCGRILRWWVGLKDSCEIWGCDYNAELVAWCQKRLGFFAQFKVNRADPPIDFSDGYFELVYAYSVLTHLSLEQQRPWLVELTRVTKPGGWLVITTHGRRCALTHGVSPDDLDRLDRDGVIVFGENVQGSNSCVAYHSEEYLRGLSSLGLEIVEHLPAGTRDIGEQDLVLFRKISA